MTTPNSVNTSLPTGNDWLASLERRQSDAWGRETAKIHGKAGSLGADKIMFRRWADLFSGQTYLTIGQSAAKRVARSMAARTGMEVNASTIDDASQDAAIVAWKVSCARHAERSSLPLSRLMARAASKAARRSIGKSTYGEQSYSLDQTSGDTEVNSPASWAEAESIRLAMGDDIPIDRTNRRLSAVSDRLTPKSAELVGRMLNGQTLTDKELAYVSKIVRSKTGKSICLYAWQADKLDRGLTSLKSRKPIGLAVHRVRLHSPSRKSTPIGNIAVNPLVASRAYVRWFECVKLVSISILSRQHALCLAECSRVMRISA